MNFPLFKATLRSNWILLLIFTVIMIMYASMIITMYDPAGMQALEQAIAIAPAGLTAALGFDKVPTDLTDFVANYFYGFLLQLFTMVHCIILAGRLVVKHVDNGSMGYLLSTPNNRVRIVLTQLCYLLASLVAMFIVFTGITLAVAIGLFGDALDLPAFLSLNVCATLMTCASGAICFFFSCLWNDRKIAIACSAGVLVLFFIFSLIGKLGHYMGGYGFVEKLSLYALLDGRAIVAGELNALVVSLIFTAIIVVCSGAGIVVFRQKNMPL